MRKFLTEGMDGSELLALGLLYLTGWVVALWLFFSDERRVELFMRRMP